MPCSGGHERSFYSEKEIENARDRASFYEAALCAVFNELKRRNILSAVLQVAGEKADIDLHAIWMQHSKKDIDRLKKSLMQFSRDELSLIKHILNEDES